MGYIIWFVLLIQACMPDLQSICIKHIRNIIAFIPPHIKNLMMQLADEFDLKKVDENNPYVRKVGWSTQATEEEKVFWQHCKNPHVRFYIDLNHDFGKGNGVLTLMPLTFLN